MDEETGNKQERERKIKKKMKQQDPKQFKRWHTNTMLQINYGTTDK